MTICAIVLTTVGVLVLLEWELNVLEAMTITLAVGLSIDFVIHLGVAFKLCDQQLTWDEKVRQVCSKTLSNNVSLLHENASHFLKKEKKCVLSGVEQDAFHWAIYTY